MNNERKIRLYSHFPLVRANEYFKSKALFPIIVEAKLDKLTMLPIDLELSIDVQLKIEQDLVLTGEAIVSGTLFDKSFIENIKRLAVENEAVVEFTWIENNGEELYRLFVEATGLKDRKKFNLIYRDVDFIPEGLGNVYVLAI